MTVCLAFDMLCIMKLHETQRVERAVLVQVVHSRMDPVESADSLLELGRFDEALKQLEKVKALDREGQTPQAALAFARAYEGLGRNAEADDAFRFAADRVPGLEAGARYVAFMAKTGRRDDAEIGYGEIERRFAKIAAPLRTEARLWRDMAAKSLGRP